MKNSKYVKLIGLILSLTLLGSCSQEWLDVNEDPNNPKYANPELVFSSGMVNGAAVVGGHYNLIGGFWSQYWSQSNASNQYRFIDQYQIQSSSFNMQWQEMYAGCLSDLQFTIGEANKSQNYSLELMATVMQAYFWQVMVDFYNKVPYNDAFKGESEKIFSPGYDNGADIYDDLIKRIDAALELEYNEQTADQMKQDLMFKGSIADWIAFANTLKLKIYLRQMYVRPDVAEAGVKALYNSGATFLTKDAALDIFVDEKGKDNFLYSSDRRNLNVGTNLRVSSTIYRYLQNNSDPRIASMVESGAQPMPQGGFNIRSTLLDPPTVAVFKIKPADPIYFISKVESYLLQAEAVAKGWGTGNDKSLYDQAVTADFARKGFSTVNNFIGDGKVYAYPVSGTFEQKQEAILMAKWTALAGSQGIESFFETNRTGYPQTSTIPAWSNNAHNLDYMGGKLTYSMEGTTSSVFPARMIYPQDEVNLNVKFKEQISEQTKVTDKVWWDVK